MPASGRRAAAEGRTGTLGDRRMTLFRAREDFTEGKAGGESKS